MEDRRTTLVATLLVVGTGVLWGIYWVPVRRLAETGLPGPWGSLAIVGAAALLLAPVGLAGRRRLAAASRVGLAWVALGGVAFALYSVAFAYGRVAIVILLFFLTPVWSTLIGRYVMGWPVPRLRIAAIAVGIAGLAVMLGAGGGVPLPRGAGEWLALASGMLWAVATTGIRGQADLRPGEAAFVFVAGAVAGAAVLALALEPLPVALPAVMPPDALRAAIGWAVAAGGLWWGLSIAALTWAVARLEPARVGILLMAEVLVGAVSAAVLAGERLGAAELAGGTLVLCAGVLEVWPVRRPRPRATGEPDQGPTGE